MAMLCMAISMFAAHVSRQEAQQVAIAFYKHHNPGHAANAEIKDVVTFEHQSLTTFYLFRFIPTGFVIVAADDASMPILGYSTENRVPDEITNPATRDWLEGYSREIFQIISNNLPNKETLKEWNSIRDGSMPSPSKDINPLLTTTWDQGCYYNALCPADPSAYFSCGHVYTGCVATAMAQIMKYHNFPPQGVGTHSYTHPEYGLQTANFGATTYNWSAMPNNVGGSNTPVATIMYHAGVSVNMDYAPDGSGAYSEDVPYALQNYFNYHPDVTIKYKNNYPNVEDFKALLRADLDQQLPIYYSGSGSVGHAFVCDGYRMNDGKFHFNWGWSGSSDGWFAIGALNPGGNSFNDNNSAVVHIKPYNADLVVRIGHPVDNAVIGVGYAVEIEAVTLRGTPMMMKLFIDDVETYSVTNDTLLYTWNTSSADLGSHDVRAYAYTATDTVYFRINLNVAEWISQASGFAAPSRGINYMSAVDSNIVWASAFDNNNVQGPCSDFTRTTDGGVTWNSGTIGNTQGLALAMVFALSDLKAYVPMYKVNGSKPMGIYFTADGGVTWTRQTTATFSNTNSFPNCVHFFDENNGWCMGDPINGEFEIYTTSNGGTTWTAVDGANIPNPTSGEWGVVGYYSAVNDTIWYGTNKGRVFRSVDRGLNWTVSSVSTFSGKFIKPFFRNGSHGLVQDKDAGTTGAICESFDGGLTWTPVTTAGTIYPTDLTYVPGTENTWVSTGSLGTNGASYSFDGGHTWSEFEGTQGAEYMQMAWVNNHCGWAGGINLSATENGAYKFIGVLMPPLPAPTGLQADVNIHDVHLSWTAPANDNPSLLLLGYNLYRDGLKLNSSPIAPLVYDDFGVSPGQYNYCVKALYSIGESAGDCAVVDVAVGDDERSKNRIRVYPNPVHGFLNIESDQPIDNISIFTYSGQKIYQSIKPETRLRKDVSSLSPGIYFIRITTTGNTSILKVVVE